MILTPEGLRFILGLKVKSIRRNRELSLSQVAESSGLSVSYLSEIENGRKFPKPEVLIRLAKTLGVGYEELVSPNLGGELDALGALFRSEFLKEFPFDLFGLEFGDLLGLVSQDPAKAAAFVQTFLEIGQSYDMHVEQFLFAALRSYQRLHANYFPELEEAAAEYRRSRGWGAGDALEERLREVLEKEYGYVVEEEGLRATPELAHLRSVYLEGSPPRLLLNPQLGSAQRAFIYGREIGFRELGLETRATTSTWIQVESFEQILNNFKASYFAGALLIDGESFVGALQQFFARDRWDPNAYLGLMEDFGATAEMFAYRLTELLPGRFGIDKLYFMRFHHLVGTDRFEPNKILNMTGMEVPRGVGLNENYCQRWVTIRALQDIERLKAAGEGGEEGWRVVRAERAHFVRENADFFVIAAAHARPGDDQTSCITLGFLLDDTFKRTVAFWDDPSIGTWNVGLTCERCPIPPDECKVRRAPPLVLQSEREQARQLEALERLRAGH